MFVLPCFLCEIDTDTLWLYLEPLDLD